MTYGQIVQSARRKKELTVKAFIQRLGIKLSPAYVTKIEIHGEIPTPSLTCKIAEVLDIDLMALVEAAKENKRRMFNELLERKWEEVAIK
jgi:transcriptional regulator with XRE-family HTH domain